MSIRSPGRWQYCVQAAMVLLALASCAYLHAGSDDGPRSIVERAVAAHGGKERLLASQRKYVKSRGTFFILGVAVDSTVDKWEDLPFRYKSMARLSAEGEQHTEVRVTTPDEVWRLFDDEPVDASDEWQRETRAGLYIRYVMTLVPLLADKKFSLAPLPETTLEQRIVVGVKVLAKGKDAIDLYFDKANGLLVRWHASSVDQYLYDYRDFNGLKYPGRSIAYIDDKKCVERTVIEFQLLKTLDAKLFQKP